MSGPGLEILPWLWALGVGAAAVVFRPHSRRPLPMARGNPRTAAGTARPTAVAVVICAALVDVRLGCALMIVLGSTPVLAARRRRRETAAAVARELPEVIDLLALSLAAGGSIGLAVTAVGTRPFGPVSSALADAAALVERGYRIADALERTTLQLGEPARPLVRALVGSDRYGTEVHGVLDRLAGDARDHRRRRAQAEARRVPVRMLLPLVLCILPAFVLLTVVPALVGTFQGLDFGAQ